MTYTFSVVACMVQCCLFAVRTSSSTTISPTARCHTLVLAQAYCAKNASYNNVIHCLSDGTKHTGRCAFFTYLCDHVHVYITGYTEMCTMPTHPPPTTRPPPGHFELSLYDAIIHGIDDRLQASKARGISTADAIKIFAKQDHTHKLYVRNKNCWAYGLDLTSISPWNSNLRNRKAGTLISPRHAVWARHYSIKTNSTIRFVDSNNNVVERRIIKTTPLSSHQHINGNFGPDIVVGLLDRDVPSTISFAKVMPQNLTTFRVPHTMHIPAMSTDQEEKALVEDFNFYANQNIALRVPQTNSLRLEFYEAKVGGDTGNPSFFVIDNELVLLFVGTTGGAGEGTSINHYFDQINHIMTQLGGNYQLSELNLDKFVEHGKTMPDIIGK